MEPGQTEVAENGDGLHVTRRSQSGVVSFTAREAAAGGGFGASVHANAFAR